MEEVPCNGGRPQESELERIQISQLRSQRDPMVTAYPILDAQCIAYPPGITCTALPLAHIFSSRGKMQARCERSLLGELGKVRDCHWCNVELRSAINVFDSLWLFTRCMMIVSGIRIDGTVYYVYSTFHLVAHCLRALLFPV